jgi:hypothetical protein
VTANFAERERYMEAFVELSGDQLPQRIENADRAIHRRIEERQPRGGCFGEEQQARADRQRILGVRAQHKRQRQPPAEAGALYTEAAS